MSWFNKNYKRRQIVGVSIFGGAGTVGSYDVEIDIPTDWDAFWDNVRSDLLDIVPCDPFGNVLTFQRTGASYANRTLKIEIDNFASPHNNSLNAIFIYFDYASESSDRSGSFTASSPKKGYILLERPHSKIVAPSLGNNAADIPVTSFFKAVADEINVYFIDQGYFGSRLETYNDRLFLEEMNYATAEAYLSNGSVSTSLMPDDDYMRFGNGFVRCRFKAGADGTDYAIVVQITTTELQKIDTRAIMRVKNLLPN